MKLSLIAKRREARDAVSFRFQAEQPIFWRAGQYLHYILPHANPDSRGIERYFTISAAPIEGHVMLTTRLPEKNRSSFKEALNALPIGGTIDADGPEGDFTITDTSLPLVFIAGGIGITPYRSMLIDLDRKGISIHAKLWYANRDEHFVYKEELDALAKKHPGFAIRYFVDPKVIDQDVIRREIPDLFAPIFYVSGPEPMVESFEKMMLNMSIPENRLKRDYFPGYDWPEKRAA